MTDELKKKFISDKRLQNYNNFDEYKQNIHLSQHYYILLSIFEVSLRNSINNYFVLKISNNWFESDILYKDTKLRIEEAKKKILQRKEILTHDKIIAELSFGFWTSLFRKSYSNLLRVKDLKAIFPNLPTKDKKIINRNTIDKELNEIRKFRNRIFHYEKITHKPKYNNIQNDIYTLLLYFDTQVYNFAKDMTKEKEDQ
ncbi:MAG: hypothetical protein U9O86_00640 [Campylobacterota bacterium]|nr:hypothetical protein [Campylobacterota bacterium]